MWMATNAVMDTNGGWRTNKRWPEAYKREIVATSFAPGASVPVIARQYDVSVNQVFSWRHRYGPAAEVVARPAPPVPQRTTLKLVHAFPDNLIWWPTGRRFGACILEFVSGHGQIDPHLLCPVPIGICALLNVE